MARIVVCPTPVDQFSAKLEIPGVGQLKAFKSALDQVPSAGDLASSMLAQAQPALAPIIQVLRVIEVLLKIFDTMKAVSNPFKLPKKLKELAKAFTALSSFLPGVPHARMARDFIMLVAAILHAFSGLINRWLVEIELLSKAMNARDTLDDPEISLIINCSKQQFVQVQASTTTTLADIGAALSIIAKVLEIIKNFIPGNIAGDVIDVVRRVALVPSQVTAVTATINSANSPAELNAVVSPLKSVSSLIEDVADRLDSISSTLSSLVGT